MGNFLDTPNTEKDSAVFVSSTGVYVGVTGMQGWRLEMEDAHIAVDMPSQRDHTFLAVFDGHGGAGAAKYAEKHLIETIESSESWRRYVEGGASNIADLGEVLIEAFLEIDDRMRVHQENTSGDTSGCTSVTAIITPNHIICANAGDSRCVLGTNKMAKPLSDDHKPNNESERKRIESAGGSVQWKRVDGDLAVSRAFGDYQFKNRPDLPAKDQKVSCVPDITIHERTGDDDILILACDGLWDVMTNNEAIDTVRSILDAGENLVDKVAEEMVDIALEKGSKDNISVVFARLPGAVVGPESKGGVERLRALRNSKNRRDSGEDSTTREEEENR